MAIELHGPAHAELHALATDYQRTRGNSYEMALAHVYGQAENAPLRDKVRAEHLAATMGNVGNFEGGAQKLPKSVTDGAPSPFRKSECMTVLKNYASAKFGGLGLSDAQMFSRAIETPAGRQIYAALKVSPGADNEPDSLAAIDKTLDDLAAIKAGVRVAKSAPPDPRDPAAIARVRGAGHYQMHMRAVSRQAATGRSYHQSYADVYTNPSNVELKRQMAEEYGYSESDQENQNPLMAPVSTSLSMAEAEDLGGGITPFSAELRGVGDTRTERQQAARGATGRNPTRIGEPPVAHRKSEEQKERARKAYLASGTSWPSPN